MIARSRRSRGFSLVELIVVIVLLGILFAAGANMVGDTMQTAYIETNNQASGSQARYAMERLTREIRETAMGATGYSITNMGVANMVFTKQDGTAVTIDYSGSTLTLKYASTTSTLSDQVSSFTLEYLDQLGATTAAKADVRFIRVTMSVVNSKTGMTDSLRTHIFLRNAIMMA
jgi:prepilin-type N-terminal cleavage/methylation domain-containing protein